MASLSLEDKLKAIQLLARENSCNYLYLNPLNYIELGAELNKVYGKVFCISRKIPENSILATNSVGFLSAEHLEDLAVPMMKVLGKEK